MDNDNNVIMGSISNALNALKNKEISAVELLDLSLSRIKTGRLNAFTCLNEEQAKKRAQDVDNGKISGALGGIPIAVKDNIDVAGLRTTCASRALMDSPPAQKNAPMVQKLLDEGAIIIGKTNMDEFAMGSSNMTSAFGNVLNPLNRSCVCGGSSGGSACAVAAHECFGALGSDTGGSIRQPASYCGVVGLKPSGGKISSQGMYPLAPSFDQAGPIARTIADCRLLFELLSGQKTAKNGKFSPKIGIIGDLNIPWEDAKNALNAAINHLESSGHHLVDVRIPLFPHAHEIYEGEAYAQMYESISALNLPTDLLGYEVKKRVKAGQSCLMNPAILAAAAATKQQMRAQFAHAFTLCDVIITPSAPSVAFGFDEDKSADCVKFSDFFTQPPSICGYAALSMPFYVGTRALPLGLQLIASEEAVLFFAAERCED